MTTKLTQHQARLLCALALSMGASMSLAATFSDANWISMAGISGADSVLRAAVVDGSGNLYLGGNFTVVGNVIANHVAKWNGSSWSALGSGMSGGDGNPPSVNALAVSGSDLYAGGWFTAAGGSAATNIAKWNGSSWAALGSGMNSSVWALAVSGSNLYAGGSFTSAGGYTASIAKWNGSSWAPLGWGLGGGFPTRVLALAVSGRDVYAGGDFTWATNSYGAAGVAVNRIAIWHAGSWSPLGPGMNYIVTALAVSGSDLYAGGGFLYPASCIAKWNGSSWAALGSGMGPAYSSVVYALAVSGSNLYAGGSFTNAGGSTANHIAKWNGSNWSALGSGVNSDVHALAVSGSDLYAGGGFTTAGGKVSAYVARAIVNPPVLAIESDGFGGYFLSFEGVPGSDYRLQRAPGLSGPWATSSPQTAPASGFLEFWDVFPPPGQGFYRSVGP